MFVIELVGPAGAGKTTLTKKLLTSQSNNVLCGKDISLRKKEQLPILFRHAPCVLPGILPRPSSRALNWDEIKSMIYLEGWTDFLEEQAESKEGILLLDQGPVFRLAALYGFGPASLREKGFNRWWNERFAQWGSFLDMIVWLDAPNAVLEDRINTRAKGHLVKGKPADEASQFLVRFRAAYAYVFERLSTCEGPQFMEFDTSKTSVEQMFNSVMTTYNCRAEINGQ